MKKSYLLVSLFMTLALAFSVVILPVSAQNDREENISDETDQNIDSTNDRIEELRLKAQQARQDAKDRLEAVKDSAAQRLDQARKKTCERQEQKINRILSNAADHGQKRLEVFQKIEDRVKEFKENKQISVENYDAIVESVDTKETDAVAAVEATGATTFECDDESTDKTFSGLLRTTIKTQNSALHEYRKSINDLIQAVKQGLRTDQENVESEEQ